MEERRSLERLGTMRRPPLSRPGDINYSSVDRFTFIHFLIGVIYGLFGMSFLEAVFLALFWEIIENSLKAYIPIVFPHATADTWNNSLMDTLAVFFGWALIRMRYDLSF